MNRNQKGRIVWEKKTIERMIRMYCKKHHGQGDGLCPECRELLDYTHKRLDLCKFGEGKTTCAKCKVHCYRPEMREKIRKVMRYAGPRMIIFHPWDAIRHGLNL